jgi:UDP-N-acetylmuramate--alanine ligase
MMQARRIHLIGIGGAGLSAIATVLLEQGYTVSGSDLQASPTTERLAKLGATVHVGHAAANLGEADLVVVSSAVPADNPEVKEAQRRGIPVVKRAEWLGHMMAHHQGVAVAGTHGKTTTTAMIAFILHEAGLDPTFIVGGDIPQLGTNAAAGKSDIFVIEADEYDHTFLGLQPEVAVVTTVEWDHPDCYPTPELMHGAFRQFIALVPPEGLLVACGDEPTVQGLIRYWKIGRMEEWKNDQPATSLQPSSLPAFQSSNLPALTTYGLNDDNDWRAFDLRPNTRGGYDFSIATNLPVSQSTSLPVSQSTNLPVSQSTNLPVSQSTNLPTCHASTSVPGVHNVKNALAALIVADRLGVPFERSTAILAKFRGVGRRFEIKGEAGGVLVVDDYAHHPTEIRATLAGARTRYPGREIWTLFQPHTYSRTRSFLDEFAAAFADADHVVVVDIFPAREIDDGSISSRDMVARMRHPDARYIGGLDEASDFLSGQLQPGDVLITMGAGDGYRVGEMIITKTRDTEE